MSVWSGIAAAGVAIALAFVAVGQPLWQWQMDGPQQRETWTYSPFSAHQQVYNKTQNTNTSRFYSYDQLASSQPRMSAALSEFGTFFALGLIAGLAGTVLAVMTAWKKLRGIFAGAALAGACAALLYVGFAMVFSIPEAATKDLPTIGSNGTPFYGQGIGVQTLITTPLAGWILVLGTALAFAWASSDIWHIVPSKKALPKKMETTVKRVPPKVVTPPPPPVELIPPAPEPNIEEVFVIGSNSLLVKHMSRSLMSDKDRDVGSMISAISSFVREAFTERDGEVHEVTLGDHRFVMCSDSGIVLAVLVSSGDTEDIVHRLRHLLAILRDRYGDRLATWQGETLEGIEDELQVLWQPYHIPPPPPVA